MKKHTLLAASAAGVTLACAMPAAAQSIDYGALEGLFNEPVTTSATGSPQRAPEAPADMQIISRVAGIDVLAFGAGHADINVRGYNQASSPRLLVLINGRQVYLDHYGVTLWQNLPVQLQEIRQIEVVKGPNTALFGFNAASGVVNIITYNPKFDDTDAVQVRAGTGDNIGGSVVVTQALGDRFFARLSAGAERMQEWSNTIGIENRRLADPRTVNVALDTITQLSPKAELRIEANWANTQQSGVPATNYSPNKSLTHSVKGTLSAETRLGLVQVTAYQNDLSAKYFIVSRTDWENRTRVLSAQDIFKVGTAHTFRVGAEYRNNTLNTAPIDTGDVSYDVYAVSGMWNWAINDRFATTVALRHDTLKLDRSGTFAAGLPLADNAFWNRDINEVSANLAVVWRPTSEDTLRASYGRGVQAPTLIELGGFQEINPVAPGVRVGLIGNPALQPSIVDNYQISYDRNLPSLGARFGARVFWQQWTDLKGLPNSRGFDIAPTRTTLPTSQFVNVGDSEMQGFEVSASGKVANGFRWSADYTYTDVEDEPFAGVNIAVRGAAFGQTTPKSRGNVAAGWSGGAIEADAFLRYSSSFDFNPPTGGPLQHVDAYATLGGRVAYRLEDGTTLAVNGQNLLNRRQAQTNLLRAERRMQFSISKAW